MFYAGFSHKVKCTDYTGRGAVFCHYRNQTDYLVLKKPEDPKVDFSIAMQVSPLLSTRLPVEADGAEKALHCKLPGHPAHTHGRGHACGGGRPIMPCTRCCFERIRDAGRLSSLFGSQTCMYARAASSRAPNAPNHQHIVSWLGATALVTVPHEGVMVACTAVLQEAEFCFAPLGQSGGDPDRYGANVQTAPLLHACRLTVIKPTSRHAHTLRKSIALPCLCAIRLQPGRCMQLDWRSPGTGI